MNTFFADVVAFVGHLTRAQRLFVLVFLFLAVFLRFYPGQDNYIWTYDQARDAYTIRSIIEEHNLMLVGPQTEFFGLRHGVLFYYFLSPFYYLSQGDPNLPAAALIAWNFTALIPITLLAYSLRKSKRDALIALALTAVSYQLIEYSRWISNLSFAVAPLAWFYYFFWHLLDKRKSAVAAGVSLGLAIQGEFFLVYLIPLSLAYLYVVKVKMGIIAKYLLGLLFGTATFLLAEMKFNFIGTKIFITEFLGNHGDKGLTASQSLSKYFDHVGTSTQQLAGGLTPTMGLYFFFFLLVSVVLFYKNDWRRPWLHYLLLIVFSHSLLFSFRFVDAVFVNIPILFPVVLLASMAVSGWISRDRLIGWGLVAAMLVTLLWQLWI